MAGQITLTTFGIGAYGLQSGKIHWMALGCQQWGFLSGGGSSNFTWTYPQSFTSSVYSIQLAMRSGGSNTASYNAFKTTSYSLTQWQGYMSLNENVSFFLLAIGVQQWGLASTSRAWATENKYPISFRIATFAISLIPRNPAENSIYTEQVGIKLCTKTGFYGGLQITCDTDNLFYIAIGIQRPNTTIFAVPTYPINVKN